MTNKELEVWAEMARRKVMFHKNKKWDTINLWGLFSWDEVSKYIKTGELLTNYKKENRTIWVHPSLKAWEEKIEPMIKEYSLSQLTNLAGWGKI